MASALCSRRNISRPAWAGQEAGATVNKNKTTTFCLTLGLIFGRCTLFFRPLQQDLDPRGGVGMMVRLEMQLRYSPKAEPAGQFMPQVVPGMFQCGHSLVLLLLATAQTDLDQCVARVGADRDVRHIYRDQAGIGKLKPDDLGKLFPDRQRYSPGTMLIHVRPVAGGRWDSTTTSLLFTAIPQSLPSAPSRAARRLRLPPIARPFRHARGRRTPLP